MASKHLRRSWTPLIIEGRMNQNHFGDHLTPIRMTTVKIIATSIGEDMEKLEPFMPCWDYNMPYPLWKTAWHSSKKN